MGLQNRMATRRELRQEKVADPTSPRWGEVATSRVLAAPWRVRGLLIGTPRLPRLKTARRYRTFALKRTVPL